MGQPRSGWGDAERAAFWAFVRGKRAERMLTQEELARALGFDRSVVTRRLNGQIKERPDAALLGRLAAALALDGDAEEQLFALAGCPAPRTSEAVLTKSATSAAPEPGTECGGVATTAVAELRSPASPRLSRRRPRRALLLGVPALLLVGTAGFTRTSWGRAGSATLPDGGYSVTIAAAARSADPGSFVLITGTSSGVPSGVRIWTVVRAGAAFWPQRPVYRVGDTWSGYARIGGSTADRGRDLDVLAVLADRAADQALGAWLQRGDHTGAYPPLSALPDGARIAAVAPVHVK